MKILLTAIGSFSSECTAKALQENGHEVVGCDIYPASWLPASRLFQKVYRAPLATDEDRYIQFLLDVCKKEGVGFLNPLTDLEIDVLNRHRTVFFDHHITLCIQSEKCLAVARDKYRLSEIFRSDSMVMVPRFTSGKGLTTDFPLPAIAKPVNGRSSEGLEQLYTQQDLGRFIGKENYIIQEMIQGDVVTVDYVRDKSGNDFLIPRTEFLRTKNGAGTTVKTFHDARLAETVSYIGAAIGACGCINMEFICLEGDYYLIDINPRFSAGIAFSHLAGYDMVTSHFNCFTGKDILPAKDYGDLLMCKHYNEEILEEI